MPVNDPNQEYLDGCNEWQLVNDCDNGSGAVKSRSKKTGSNTLRGIAGTAYLPPPDAANMSGENKERYKSYLERANFVNFTSQTREGMIGMVFRKETVIKAPSDIDYLIKNVNGGGLSTDQMIKEVSNQVMLFGRYGLLVDYPCAPLGLTEAEVTNLNLKAKIVAYPATSIINWRTAVINGETKLSMIVLREIVQVQDKDDEFKLTNATHHRVLLLKNNMYVQNIYDAENELVYFATGEIDEEGNEITSADLIPRNHDGAVWDHIPFTFIGSVNNSETVDKAPLYDIAEVNISHYRNSADYEESSFLVGQPTPAIAGLNQGWVDKNMPNGVTLGSMGAILLPEGGSASLLQAASNQMPLEGMKLKEEQLVKIGTRLIEDGSGNQTVDGVKIRFAGQNSKIGSLITNVEDGFIKCYEWAQMFMGGSGEIKIDINKELYDSSLDPQSIVAQIQLMDRGVIAVTDMRTNLRKANMISSNRTDKDIDDEAATTLMNTALS